MTFKALAVIVIPPHLQSSGAVNAGKALSMALRNFCDIDVALMSKEDKIEEAEELKIIHSKSTPLFATVVSKLPNKIRTPLYRSSIPKLISSGNYQLVHIHNPMPTLEMKRIAQTCVEQNIPYIVSTHGFVEVTSGGNVYSLRPLEKIAWQFLVSSPLKYVVDHASLLFPTAPNDCEILSGMNVPNNKMKMVTNGVNPIFYHQPNQTITERLKLQFALISSSNPILFFLANHTANKGIQVLLDALEQVNLPFTALIGGKKKPDFDYSKYADFEPAQQEKRIIFTDRLSDEEVHSLYHLADLFVFPTVADTLPLVILEAMASQLPILSTEVGGIPYQVEADCGLLVKPNDAISLANGLTTMLSMPKSRLKEMGRNASKRVKSTFDWHQSASIAYEGYKDVLGLGDDTLQTTM